jgi:hypothetical protein
MQHSFAQPAVLIGLALQLACVASTETSGAGISPLTICSGAYVCRTPEPKTFDATLARSADGRCLFEGLELTADGRLIGPAISVLRWSGDERRLSICNDSNWCTSCVARPAEREPAR